MFVLAPTTLTLYGVPVSSNVTVYGSSISTTLAKTAPDTVTGGLWL